MINSKKMKEGQQEDVKIFQLIKDQPQITKEQLKMP